MNKRILFILFGGLGIFVITVGIFIWTKFLPNNQPIPPSSPQITQPLFPSPSGTPTLSLPSQTIPQTLTLTLLTPASGATQVALSTPVVFTLSQPVPLDALYFSVSPVVPFTAQAQGNQYTITFSSPLSPNVLYYIFAGQKDQETYQQASFTTITDSSVPRLDYGAQTNMALLLHAHPDGYLKSFGDYTGSTFSITSTLSETPTEHYAFTVTLTGPNKTSAKQDFINWALSKGLNQTQIDNLDITYQ